MTHVFLNGFPAIQPNECGYALPSHHPKGAPRMNYKLTCERMHLNGNAKYVHRLSVKFEPFKRYLHI